MEGGTIRRRDQIVHLQHTLSELDRTDLPNLPFAEVKQLIIDRGMTMNGIDTDRYVAMLLSYARGNTTDEDVRWHLW